MPTVNPTQNHQQPARRLSRGLGYAYATLGLRAGEARVDAIRFAAHTSADQLKQAVDSQDNLVELLADVATSTYRLLDPRKRVRKMERIQLCLISEMALELQQSSKKPLILPIVGRGVSPCDLSA
jgi:hypothetical protein